MPILQYISFKQARWKIEKEIQGHKFSNNDINKFILLLWKGVCPYEYMDEWEDINETTLPENEFYNNLNMENISDGDYMQAKRVCKGFEIKKLGEYCDFHLTLLLADVLENFRKIYLKIYHLDPVKFLWARGLAWQATVKKTEVKLELLTDIDMVLIVEKGTAGGIYHEIQQYANANNKYMKKYDKNKELPYLKYWDVNNLYSWIMLQKLPVNNLE